MRLAFVRHGEARAGEADPELTSWGHRAAGLAGDWLVAQGFSPSVIWHTPTSRTRQTAEAVALRFAAPLVVLASLPEDDEGWHDLLGRLSSMSGDVTLVGHHPTQGYLSQRFGPPPEPIPQRHRAGVLLLSDNPWRITACWPGKPS